MLHELAQQGGLGRGLRALLHTRCGRPFFQAGLANFNPNAVTKVDYKNPDRAPLLLVTGAEDRICPPSVNKANFKKQAKAPSATEHKEYPALPLPGAGRLGGGGRLHPGLDHEPRR